MTETTVSDLPTSKDALDFEPYARALADISKTGGTPLTIGIFGTWGSGKTSLMEMIKKNLPETYAKVWFNAWKYDKEQALWRAFLTAVLDAMKEKARKDNQPTEEFDKLQSLLYRSMEFEKQGGVTIDLAKLGGAFAKGAVNLSLSFIPGLDALKKLAETLQSNAGKSVDEAADAIARERTKIFVAQISSLEQFQSKFKELVEAQILSKDGRLVVFVDDLDRCLPEKTIEALEAIKLFMDAPGCVFILGLDDKVISRAIENKYKELGAQPEDKERYLIEGANYLEKIIQLPFNLPSVERKQMSDFVRGLVGQWEHDECPNVFAEGLGSNPRQIKRAVNTFLMLSSVAREKHNTLAPVLLAKVVAIQNIFPELYQEIARKSRRYLKDLEEYFRARQEPEQKRGQALEISGRTEFPSSASGGGARGGGETIEPPAALREFFRKREKMDAIGRVLTMHPREMKEASFAGLSLDEIDPYFTLTARAEAPAPAVTEAPAEKSAPAPARDFEPQMVRIPAGKFWMGSEERDNEKPPHEVELPEYLIGKYPVTNREYHAFVQATGHKPPRHWEGGNYPPEKAEHPVVNVSWNDAMAYCKWLSEETGKEYRLPSEAEWEKAARGTDGRKYPWGDEFDPKKCNSKESGIGDTSEVGRFSPQGDSPYGCADMSGNVWEWCHSLYKPYPYDANDGRENEKVTGSHVLRGGAYWNDSSATRCAYRDGLSDLDDFGLRVCASPIAPV